MTLTHCIEPDIQLFELTSDELEQIDGGTPLLAAAAPILGGTIAAAGVLVGIAAFGYTIGKDLAESSNEECECSTDTDSK